ncbi:Glycerophosphoryl diester phosphodiesterase [Flavobacterium sp. 9R]|uniref:glycerophosphodiester phosphodiesterase n=1 Tax=Flavobacterium sp. 9R TaxID=2653143 RepID=UPI0012F05564|nr:glycerophosphodiester phosphodiesterase family protein [Flavobacterium sp. 9R]VXA96624.1 Glycerophosphoryl diester phosphodiesterase [Flavobacterium sp. 9R]
MKYLFYFFILFVVFSCDGSGNAESDSLIESFPETISSGWYQKGKDSIRIIAHGGASAYEPFNSIPAFKKAFELNSDGIELDLMNSKDDSLMVFHDLNTERFTGANYNIVDTKFEKLRTLDIGKGEKMPFLNEVFKILPPGKKIYLEIKWWQDPTARKNARLIEKLIDQIEKSGRINDCVVVCLDINYLIKIKLRKPELNLFWINYDVENCKKTGDLLSKYNLQGCNILYSIINLELSNSLVARNKFLFAWTINDGALALDLCKKYKINGIFTDKPDVIRNSLSKLMK